MTTVYLPWIGKDSAPPAQAAVNPRGFGIAIRSQNYATPRARIHDLLRPACWHDWSSHWPGPGGYPCIWNPVVTGAGAEVAAWNASAVTPGQWWFIGNEPLDAYTREMWVTPYDMARQTHAFAAATGAGYVLCGETPDEEAFTYCRFLLELGCDPVAWHWHIYEHDPRQWQRQVEKVMQFDPRRPHFVTETNARGGTVDEQRRLMDCIRETLATFQEVHAVFWYVTWAPDCRAEECLLDGDGAACGLTATGQAYVAGGD